MERIGGFSSHLRLNSRKYLTRSAEKGDLQDAGRAAGLKNRGSATLGNFPQGNFPQIGTLGAFDYNGCRSQWIFL